MFLKQLYKVDFLKKCFVLQMKLWKSERSSNQEVELDFQCGSVYFKPLAHSWVVGNGAIPCIFYNQILISILQCHCSSSLICIMQQIGLNTVLGIHQAVLILGIFPLAFPFLGSHCPVTTSLLPAYLLGVCDSDCR